MLLCSGVPRRRCCIGVYSSAFLDRPACIGRFCINSQLLPDAAALSSMQGTPASSIFPIALRLSAAILFAMALPASSSAAASRSAASLARRPRQQHLHDGASPRRPGQEETSSAPPASNRPHPAEKSTPVWLAIWRAWAGFANSQLRCAAFRCTYSYICVPIPVTAVLSRCSDIANLSAHLHRLPTPPPYLRQMRLPPGRVRRYPMGDEAIAWPGMEFEQITEHGCES